MFFKKKKIEGEVDLACPRDGKVMNKRVIGDVVIDECPKCRGLWLDDKEIDKLIAHASKIGLQKEIEKKIKQQEQQAAKKTSTKKKSAKKKE